MSLGVQGVGGLGDDRLPRAVGARARAWASRCWPGPGRRRCSSSPRSTGCTPCCATIGARAAGAARGAERGRSARCWPRASATARCPSPTGCPTARRSSTRPASRCALPERRLRPRVDGGRARRAPRRGDRPRRRAGHDAASSSTPPPRRRAGDRQRAPEGRPARARGGAARLARAHRRGRRRRPPAASSATSTTAPSSSSSALALDLRLLRARLKATPRPARDRRRARGQARRRARRAARARARHPSRDPHRPRARARGRARSPSARRCPVEVDVALDERLPPAVEAAAYFVVAEALTNVAKLRAGARARASILRAATAPTWSSSSATTASAAPTSTPAPACAACSDRLAALDGTLAIDSPPGAGTRLRGADPARRGGRA